MKNVISFLLGSILTAAILYFGACNNNPNAQVSRIGSADSISLRGISNIVIIDSNEAKRYISYYQQDHDTTRDSTITYSVFFGRDAISFMGHYFDTASRNVAGVRVFNIQYNADMSRYNNRSQRHPKQQTLLFVPEDLNKRLIWSAWDTANFKSFLLPAGGLNHGELCPIKCP